MNDHRLVAILALLLPTLAQAASVATPIVACKAEADSKKVFEFISKNDTVWTGQIQNVEDPDGRLLLPFEGHGRHNRQEGRPISVRSPHRRARLCLDRQRYDK